MGVGNLLKRIIGGGISTSPHTKFGFWRKALEGIKKNKRYQERLIGKARNIAVVNTIDATERLNDYMEVIYTSLTQGKEPNEFQEAVEGALTECNILEKSGKEANEIYYNYSKNPLNISAIQELWLKIKGEKSIAYYDEKLFEEEEKHWSKEKSKIEDEKRKKYYNLAIKLYKIYKQYIISLMRAYGIE